MKSASELLEAYLNNVATPKVSAAQFAEDGVLELPWVNAHAQGPAAVEKLLAGMLAKVPDFRFKNLTYFIQTPDKVAAEYQVEAKVLSTGKIYRPDLRRCTASPKTARLNYSVRPSTPLQLRRPSPRTELI